MYCRVCLRLPVPAACSDELYAVCMQVRCTAADLCRMQPIVDWRSTPQGCPCVQNLWPHEPLESPVHDPLVVSITLSQDPEAADLLARSACDPSNPAASQEDVQAAVQEYERLLKGGTTPGTPVTAAAAAGGPRQRKRQKSSAAAADAQEQQAVQLPHDVAVRLYCLYCAYLEERLEVLMADESSVMDAAACAQQLFKLMLQAHEAGAAAVELYQQWVALACKLKQNKVGILWLAGYAASYGARGEQQESTHCCCAHSNTALCLQSFGTAAVHIYPHTTRFLCLLTAFGLVVSLGQPSECLATHLCAVF